MSSGLFYFSSSAFADCDCGSTDAGSPCTGTNISVEVEGEHTVGFSWDFNSGGSEAYCGQFANGDYWIAPRSGSSDVTVTRVQGSGGASTSVDENPQVESMGLIGASDYGNYNAAENILADLPKTFSKSTSLVAAIQKNESAHGVCGTKAIEGNCVDAYHVVTVLDSVPPNAGADILRPSIDEAEKELLSLSDFDLNKLPKKSFLAGASNFEQIRQRWSHSTEVLAMPDDSGIAFSEGGRAFRADLLVDDYAAGVARSWHDDLMVMLSSESSEEEKRAAIAAMLTYGKDLYFAAYDGNQQVRSWGAGAGQHLGRFPPAVLFAALARDPVYANNLKKTSVTTLGLENYAGPHELEQVNKGPNGPVWGDGFDNLTDTNINSYWSDLLDSQCFDGARGTCNPNVGKKTFRDPYGYIDGPPNEPGTSYMSVSIGPQRALVASMFLIPRMCEIVNFPELVEYVDRVHSTGIQTANDPCAPPDPRENPETCDAYRLEGCKYYGLNNTGEATWGPDPSNPSQCIKNGPGQNGRFPESHGTQLGSGGYVSDQVEANWEEIRGKAPRCGLARIMAPTNITIVPQK